MLWIIFFAVVALLVGAGYIVGKRRGRPLPRSRLKRIALLCSPPFALGLALGGGVMREKSSGALGRENDPFA